MKLIVHATNIHTGGGAVLLNELITNMPSKNELLVFLDQRFVLPDSLSKNIDIVSVAPTVTGRLKAEYMLLQASNENTKVICFGNLPPLFKLKSSVILFLQNRHLVDDQYLNKFPIKTRIKIFIEKLWFKFRASNINIYMVQTQSMRAALENIEWAKDSQIMLAPFISFKNDFQTLGNNACEKYDFLYVASGQPHKNHVNLILAWCILAEMKQFPSLCLTIDGRLYPDLLLFINKKKNEFGLRIENASFVPYQSISRLYSKANALIYPSLSESFGMPLLEAQKLNIPILASELDFVRDNVEPAQTFNPSSPVSIARAVTRYFNIVHIREKICDPKEFIERIFGLANGKIT
jgi:glycosyltransferase involved in cell wall biosynthesis